MLNVLFIKNLQRILSRIYGFIPFSLTPKYAFPPLHAYFEVTYRCNLRCEMCHFLQIIEDTEENRGYRNEMPAEEIKKAVLSLPRYAVITYTGGEVFMKNDFLDVLEFTAARNKTHVITNGTVLTPHIVEKLMRIRSRSLLGPGLFFMGVSLEGGEEQHDRIAAVPGSFRKTTRGLEALIEKRKEAGGRYPLVHLTCVISRSNIDDLNPLYEYANAVGVDVCNFVLKNPATYWHVENYDQAEHLARPQPPAEEIDPGALRKCLDGLLRKSASCKTQLRFSPNGITPDEIVRYYSNQSSYKDYRCYAAWSKVGISAYGDVFSCPHYRSATLRGNGEAFPWNVKGYREFRSLLKKNKIFPGCLGCCQSEYVGS
ncbi:MAG: radical SAM protein [Nitrospinae bacterium]|nr:radical SAM protein [Nitrospinota bacterium]